MAASNDPKIAQALRVAVASALPFDIALPAPRPASTCTNLPLPASPAPAQNEPKVPRGPLPARPPANSSALRTATRNAQNEPTTPRPGPPQPAQTCHDPPPRAPAQNEPTPRFPLSPRQLRAARLLVAGQTARTVAATLQVNPHTISDWKNRPDFQAEVARLLAASDAPFARR
jgi:hypothetical protein